MSGFRAWGALIGLVTAEALVGACGDRGERPGDGNREATSGVGSSQADDIPEVEVPALWAVGEARDIQTLTSSAEVVFRGRVLAFKGQQSAKSPAGSEAAGARPRWADLPVSRFEVSVENVMSGQLPTTTVVLEQIGGVETRPDGTQARIRLEDDPPVRVGTTYLIFGKLQPDGSVAAPPLPSKTRAQASASSINRPIDENQSRVRYPSWTDGINICSLLLFRMDWRRHVAS